MTAGVQSPWYVHGSMVPVWFNRPLYVFLVVSQVPYLFRVPATVWYHTTTRYNRSQKVPPVYRITSNEAHIPKKTLVRKIQLGCKHNAYYYASAQPVDDDGADGGNAALAGACRPWFLTSVTVRGMTPHQQHFGTTIAANMCVSHFMPRTLSTVHGMLAGYTYTRTAYASVYQCRRTVTDNTQEVVRARVLEGFHQPTIPDARYASPAWSGRAADCHPHDMNNLTMIKSIHLASHPHPV